MRIMAGMRLNGNLIGLNVRSQRWLRRRSLIDLCGGVLPVLLLLQGCNTARVVNPPAVIITSTPVTLAEIAPAPPPSPTVTPARNLILGVPSEFAIQAGSALEAFAEGSPGWIIQLRPGHTDQDQLDLASLDLALLPDADGLSLWEQPLALAVPLTSDWDDLTLDQAHAIMDQESPYVAVLPWAEMTPGLRALRVDGLHPGDPGYPLNVPWSLHSRSETERVAQALAPLLTRYLMDDSVIQIAAVGDVMLDRTFGVKLTAGELDFPFSHVLAPLQSADLTIGNLESALGERGSAETKGYTFRAPPAAAKSLASAGFDVMSLANNHAMDFGPELLLQAIDLLQGAGIRSAGAGVDFTAAHLPVVFELDGFSLAILAYVDVPQEYRGFDARAWRAGQDSPGVAWADPDQIHIDVAAADQTYDVVVVLLHSGYENVVAPSSEQRLAAHAAVEAGADLVLGHHAHLLQGVELYQGGVIAYGLGNFAFEDAGPPESGILRIWLDGDGVRAFDLLPVTLDEFGAPYPAQATQAQAIRSLFLERTRALASTRE